METKASELVEGQLYAIQYKCRDLGYGIEEGAGNYTYRGRESWGKLVFIPEDASGAIYLFEDEVADVQEQADPADVWEYVERVPVYARYTADLWHWSTNYDAGQGPITLFLDLIGWSMEELGDPLYSLRDASLGYVELGKLGDALTEYANRPIEVREWIDGLLSFDES